MDLEGLRWGEGEGYERDKVRGQGGESAEY